ncbi:MAG: nuclear transport factor 2 family protein [Thermoleophilaceae bacterium]
MATNVEVVEGIYAPRFRVWDAEVLDHMHAHVWDPGIDWRAIEGAPDDVGVMHGRDRLRRYYEEWIELFDAITLEAVEITDVGDHVAARVRVTARSRSGGVPTELDVSIVYTLRDGRILRGREYARWEEALAAASDSRGAALSPDIRP